MRVSESNGLCQFADLLTAGPHSQHLNSHLTVFAPSNEAVEAYQGARDSSFILNHLGELVFDSGVRRDRYRMEGLLSSVNGGPSVGWKGLEILE